jgi:hypothetical protein
MVTKKDIEDLLAFAEGHNCEGRYYKRVKDWIESPYCPLVDPEEVQEHLVDREGEVVDRWGEDDV